MLTFTDLSVLKLSLSERRSNVVVVVHGAISCCCLGESFGFDLQCQFVLTDIYLIALLQTYLVIQAVCQ